MKNIVFTGPAFDGNGNSILRDHLAGACLKAGFRVQLAVKPDTDALIASRTDTVKAVRASARGLTVLTYPQFIARHLAGIEITKGGIPNKYTDKVVKDMLVPDFTIDLDPQYVL
jgi:hypothetical protein